MKKIITLILASLASTLALSAEPQGPWSFYQPGAKQETSEDEAEEKQSPQCEPDLSKWSASSIEGHYYLKEAAIIGAKNNKYIKIWVSNVKNYQNCTFEKQYITIDCISKAVGQEWYSLKPVDPDLDFYSVVKDICGAYAEEPEAPKPRRK